MTSCYIVAEVGVNHNGDLGTALRLVETAASAGANAVKFQAFTAEKLVKVGTPRAAYQKQRSTESDQFEMLRQLELSPTDLLSIRDAARDTGIEFVCTPFDSDMLKFLVEEAGVQKIKVASGDLTNLPFLHDIGATGLPVLLSTGMGTAPEISLALGALAHARSSIANDIMPQAGPEAFTRILEEGSVSRLLPNVALLHCTSEYPMPPSSANLLAIQTLRETYGLRVGYSDHSLDVHLSVAAVALGASIVEKHLTWDTDASGPDHRSSLNGADFHRMVDAIRTVEAALGSGIKKPSPRELETANVARRGLYAARDIAIGHIVGPSDVAILRPPNGVPPSRYWEAVGSVASRFIGKGEELIL